VLAHSAKAGAIYARPEAPQKTPRAIEYELLARVTQAMSLAWGQRKDNFAALMLAIDDNLRLWATLAADVAEPGNGLPAPLRAQLFYLYEFAMQHSKAVRNGTASVEVLVDINTAVMRGLRGETGAA
jgi:flagellar biosynthesis activator protein FlaF